MRQADKFTDFAGLAATVVANWPDFNICPFLHTDKVALINKKLLPMKVGANYSFSCFGSFNHGRVRKLSFGSIASLPFLPFARHHRLQKFKIVPHALQSFSSHTLLSLL
jgi:hypothetical protein